MARFSGALPTPEEAQRASQHLIDQGILPEASRAHAIAAFLVGVIPPGETIIEEGEAGDALYVILEGRALVSVRTEDGNLPVVEIQPGSVFGEQALQSFFPRRRTATVTALDAMRVVRLTHVDFQALCDEQVRHRIAEAGVQQAIEKLRALSSALASMPLSMPPTGLTPIDMLRGGVVYSAGDPSTSAYFIVRGTVELRRPGSQEPIARLGPGQVFGHRGLANGAKRTASAIADRHTFLLAATADQYAMIEQADHANRIGLSFAAAYATIKRGTVLLREGDIDGQPAITCEWRLPNGRAVSAIRLLQDEQFVISVNEGTITDRCSVPGKEPWHVREIGLDQHGHILSIMTSGPWSALPALTARLLNREAMSLQEISTLQQGKAPIGRDGLICPCLGADRALLADLATEGARDPRQIASACGAGAACGGCVEDIQRILDGRG